MNDYLPCPQVLRGVSKLDNVMAVKRRVLTAGSAHSAGNLRVHIDEHHLADIGQDDDDHYGYHNQDQGIFHQTLPLFLQL
jgi:hypothetical protein